MHAEEKLEIDARLVTSPRKLLVWFVQQTDVCTSSAQIST